MKKKVREALEQLRTELDSHVSGPLTLKYTTDLRALVEWAEKKAKRPESLKVGDAVRLTRDIQLNLTVLRKGATGTVHSTDVHDPFDVDVTMHVPCPYQVLGFRLSELEKVESNV